MIDPRKNEQNALVNIPAPHVVSINSYNIVVTSSYIPGMLLVAAVKIDPLDLCNELVLVILVCVIELSFYTSSSTRRKCQSNCFMGTLFVGKAITVPSHASGIIFHLAACNLLAFPWERVMTLLFASLC